MPGDFLKHINRLSIPYLFLIVLALFLSTTVSAQDCSFTIARLKYNGGGDWYANPSSLPNLVREIKARTAIPICDSVSTVEISDDRLFTLPFIYITGHGDFRLSDQERLRLRRYLIGGGFLWADDNYGLDKSFREELAALFPQNPLQPVPSTHPIYQSFYKLKGLPKIHEHDGIPAQGYGVFFEKRMLIYYTYSSDIGDGMEDIHIHNDGEALHELALKMGINVIYWYFNP
ncbi:MAG TPA: DUF4159 domain-containing protein [Chitinispirillaceae bacterium]|nr:DUF4159 domain-containing protein [Chitinispirillaceae bacterium]